MNIQYKRLHPDAKMPNYGHPGDAGLDLYALETKTLHPGERHIFMNGFALEFDFGWVACVKDKGSLPAHHGLHTMGGVFDAGYRGEYSVQLINLGNTSVTIEKGQKIAQLVIYRVAEARLTEINGDLSESSRGGGKLGSTGKF